MPQSEMVGAFQQTPHRVVVSCPDCQDLHYGDEAHRCGTFMTSVPATPAQLPDEVVTPVPIAMAALRSGLGTRDDIQQELDGIVQAIRQFHIKHPDQVLRECSAYGARLTELCLLLHRVESQDRQYQRLRTMQVQKIIDEIDRQFRTASRLVEIQRQDLELIR